MKVFIGYECSGVSRRAFEALGHDVISCDLLPAEDGANNHVIGDVPAILADLGNHWVPDVAVFHPPCTYHNVASAWAFADPDHARYPKTGGYHQRVQPGTLVGAARRAARAEAEAEVQWLRQLPFIKVIENPRGTLTTRAGLPPPADVVQPFEFGHDASKATCLWCFDADGDPVSFQLLRYAEDYVKPRLVPRHSAMGMSDKAKGSTGPTHLPRWGNQTDSGQNRLSPGENRAGDRSRTYEGIGRALALALVGTYNRLNAPLEDLPE